MPVKKTGRVCIPRHLQLKVADQSPIATARLGANCVHVVVVSMRCVRRNIVSYFQQPMSIY